MRYTNRRLLYFTLLYFTEQYEQELRCRRGTTRRFILVSSYMFHDVWELETFQTAKVIFNVMGIGSGAIR